MKTYLETLFRFTCASIVASAAILGGRTSLGAPDVTLYDVDFSDPPHVVGLPPVFGAGPFTRDTPTSGPFGNVEVVAGFGLLADRPARLLALDGDPNDGFLGGSNLLFDLNPAELPGTGRVIAQIDVLVGDVSTSAGLGVFFDAPAIHKVEFSNDGNIRIVDATGVNFVVGPYTPGDVYTVRMAFDRENATWSASINGNPLYFGPSEDVDLQAFRVAMTTGDLTTTSFAFVDNVIITITVPEPATLTLMSLAIAGAVSLSARRPRGRKMA